MRISFSVAGGARVIMPSTADTGVMVARQGQFFLGGAVMVLYDYVNPRTLLRLFRLPQGVQVYPKATTSVIHNLRIIPQIH